MTFYRCLAAALATTLLVLAGCSSGGSPGQPPEGWTTSENSWWKQGVDTAMVFQPMGDLTQMGVREEAVSLEQGGLDREQFVDAIKRSLVELYRNNPRIIDSLFQQYAVTSLDTIDISGDGVVEEGGRLASDVLNRGKKAAYDPINEHYREPRATTNPSLSFPDSLMRQDISGTIELQIHLDASAGDDSTATPDAIRVLQSIHPTVDAYVMRAMIDRGWQPAYVLRDGAWVPVDSWVHYSQSLQMPGAR
jgi:hypothetical protein